MPNIMDLESQLAELKYDYTRLQNDLEKRESLNQNIDPLLKQLEDIEKEIANIRSKLRQK
ncbi:DNA repair/chromosome segregation ATPase [Staphylococcus petrasii]|uniref:DNA repair/chromosome segregation ATPase n=2 Tax=Staphylococcus petrasii TaxID=1276936 RepID=A0A380FXI5_9STAP|nr:DNA repair/chromosome segregation ATPase [Staphylococcus petrasii]